MELILAILVGILVTCGCALLLDGDRIRLLFGIVVLSHAANLLIFVSSGLGTGTAIIAESANALPDAAPDALAQALMLTAIVIGFGVSCFCLFLSRRIENSEAGDTA